MKKTKLQYFRPDREVFKRSFKYRGTRPNPQDLKEMATDTIADVGKYISDKKQQEKMTKEAIETIKEVEKKEK